jgi:beta-N-acetylhexosaminidase
VTGTESELFADAATVLQPGFAGTTAPDWLRRQVADGLGGVALFGRNCVDTAQLAALTATLRAENPDVVIAIDEEGGDVTRLETRDGSSYPGNSALGVVDDVELTEQVATAIGADLAACGVSLNYAPSADVNSNPDNPVIGTRSFGAEADLVARHTAAYVRGLQATGVAACAKHFPGHGDTAVDSHVGLPEVGDDLDALRAGPLRPFVAAIAAGARAVMSAHILLPAVDDVPATMSRALLTGLLRDELGFTGVIVSDAVEMAAIASTVGVVEGAVRTIRAGADAVCVGGGLVGEDTALVLRYALVQAVREGRLEAARLHEAADRVRALGRWARSSSVSGAEHGVDHGVDRGIGLVAARRAVRVFGSLPALTAPVHTVEFSRVANIAVGTQTAWGVAEPLAAALPGSSGQRVGPPAAGEVDVTPLLAAAGGRRLVLVVRDMHRVPWIERAVRALVDAAGEQPPVVVEMGLPYGRVDELTKRGVALVASYGAARVCGQAVVEVLTGR